jgi:hypothetical protein
MIYQLEINAIGKASDNINSSVSAAVIYHNEPARHFFILYSFTKAIKQIAEAKLFIKGRQYNNDHEDAPFRGLLLAF